MLLMDDELPTRKSTEMPVRPRVAAKAAGVSLTTLRRWRAAGLITSLRTRGGQFRYYLSEVIAYRDRDKAAKVSPFAGMPTPSDARKHMIESNRNQFNFRCPESLRGAVQQMAGDLRRNVSDVIRMAIEEAVAKHQAAATRKHEAIKTRNTKDSSEIASPSAIRMFIRAAVAEAIADTHLRNYGNTPERSSDKDWLNAIERLIDAKFRDNEGG